METLLGGGGGGMLFLHNVFKAILFNIIKTWDCFVQGVGVFTLPCSLGSTRFFKVAKASTQEGNVVVKVFVIHDPSLPLASYKTKLDGEFLYPSLFITPPSQNRVSLSVGPSIQLSLFLLYFLVNDKSQQLLYQFCLILYQTAEF